MSPLSMSRFSWRVRCGSGLNVPGELLGELLSNQTNRPACTLASSLGPIANSFILMPTLTCPVSLISTYQLQAALPASSHNISIWFHLHLVSSPFSFIGELNCFAC